MRKLSKIINTVTTPRWWNPGFYIGVIFYIFLICTWSTVVAIKNSFKALKDGKWI